MEFSNLMLGTAQFGVDYGIANTTGKPSQDQVDEIISFAWKNGVNCLDTASSYGESEMVIGNALENLRLAHQMKIVSKVAHFSDDLSLAQVKEHIHKSIFGSLERLKVDYLDVCLFHHEKYFYAIELLNELKEQGVVKSIGLSFTGTNFDDATKVLSSPLVDVVQVPGSLLDRRFENGGFALAREYSKPVFVRSVYLQGLLVQETAPPRLAAMQPALDAIGKLAREYDLSREALCVRYMLGVNGASSLLMGVETLEQLTENSALVGQGALPLEIHQHVAQNVPLLSANYLCPHLWPKG
jgi:aryl-alcohol dehydrogenase-like predicted oxidoreductase